MNAPDYNNPTQEMIDSIGVDMLPSDIEAAHTERLLRLISELVEDDS